MSADRHGEIQPKPETARLFFGLWPSPAVAAQLGKLAGDLAGQFGGRATRPETIHLTLAFLGDVALSRLGELSALADSVKVPEFSLETGAIQHWPHKRLLWIGLNPPVPELLALRAQLFKALHLAGFRISGGNSTFTPHVTLVRQANLLAETVLPSFSPLNWSCADFVLVRSQLTACGSNYEVLARFPRVGAGHKSLTA